MLASQHAHDVIVEAIRAGITYLRSDAVLKSREREWTAETIAANVEERLQRELRPRLRNVINATGIVLHTNLGRAPIFRSEALAANEGAVSQSELDLR